jgi:NADPH-dependent 2,4-dienoyl-CoA reductase/sulfur reductase-like enzyme
MPVLPPEAGERLVRLLTERGIAYSPGHKIVSAEPGVVRFENGAERRFDLLIAVPPHRSPAVVREVPGLTDESGLVPVDRETVGGSLALKANGDFLARPGPQARLDEPSEKGFADKVAFEAERLAAWFGE